jgi:hypothetical protein
VFERRNFFINFLTFLALILKFFFALTILSECKHKFRLAEDFALEIFCATFFETFLALETAFLTILAAFLAFLKILNTIFPAAFEAFFF